MIEKKFTVIFGYNLFLIKQLAQKNLFNNKPKIGSNFYLVN